MTLEPLTAEAFAPWGDVVDAPAPGERPQLEASLAAIDGATAPVLAFNNVAPHALPFEATQMERHNRSSQCFIPLDVSRYVLMVALDVGGKPDMTRLRAFVARGDQAVNYHLGAWHHPMRVLDRPGRFAVLMWTTGRKPDDEEWADLTETVLLVG
nr:ureidoglycolate lyase [Plastoroseomonas arctica]